MSKKLKIAREKLNNIFGYNKFRKNQFEIIRRVLNHENCVVIMPTGSGKSLCYQIPALVFDNMAVVISPLISLMKNQVMQLDELGVKAEVLNSSLTREKYNEVVERIRSRDVEILYLAPETLIIPFIKEILKEANFEFLAIDEAHCISEWGHDFRPEYRQIAEIRNYFGDIPTIALTATATPLVEEDIIRNLNLADCYLFKSSFDRKNLYLEVRPKENPIEQVTEFLDRFPNESCIIYCFSRKRVDSLAKTLSEKGYSVLPYHAGLSGKKRQVHQDQFIKDDIDIIVATVAFGMGIDKPDIRAVIHYDLTKNIETYYQQIGRAGRDGTDAYCLLLYGYQDVAKIKYLFKEKEGQELRNAYTHLEAMLNFVETDNCRRRELLKYFGESYNKSSCQACDNCLKEKKAKEDLTIPVQKFLSCMYRTGMLYGSNHIIKILRGSKDKKIISKNHDKISTYGIGKELSAKQWLHLYRQLNRANVINKDLEFGSLLFTNKAKNILKGEHKFYGNLIEEKKAITKKKIKKDYDQKLFKILRKKRKEIANDLNLPPFTIFHDRTLMDISANYPTTEKDLLKMYGIGKVKLKKYADILLDIIASYLSEKEKNN